MDAIPDHVRRSSSLLPCRIKAICFLLVALVNISLFLTELTSDGSQGSQGRRCRRWRLWPYVRHRTRQERRERRGIRGCCEYRPIHALRGYAHHCPRIAAIRRDWRRPRDRWVASYSQGQHCPDSVVGANAIPILREFGVLKAILAKSDETEDGTFEWFEFRSGLDDHKLIYDVRGVDC